MPQTSIRIGEITVTAVSDGVLKSSLDVIVGLAPEECARLAGCAYDAPVWLPVFAYVFDLPGRRVLVDAGSGTNMQPTLGELPANLRAIGIAPESIDTVLLTHLHPDHANGLIDAGGKPNFPNAELILHQVESRFYLERDANESDSERVRRTLVASKQATAPYRGRIKTVPDGEVMPGVSAHLQPGHTPGHTCWLLRSGGEKLLIWGDIVHLPSIQVPRPDAALVFDVDPKLAPLSRAKVFEWVTRERMPVAGAHMPAPGFATIARRGDGFAYTAGA
jgi:glyoxylase-like metal-dependent hydrolase (beta-lactamase superfamily II)